MTPDHTPGPLHIECEPWYDDCDLCLWSADGQDNDGGVHVASVSADEVGVETRNANARRLVAAWNAVRGLTVAQLEIVASYPDDARLPWLAWYAQTAGAASPFARQRT